MIKKLRTKFILINMVFVMTILTVVVAFIVLENYQRIRSESENFMRMELLRVLPERAPEIRNSSETLPERAAQESPRTDENRFPGGERRPKTDGIPETVKPENIAKPETPVTPEMSKTQNNERIYHILPSVIVSVNEEGEITETIERELDYDAEALPEYVTTALSEKGENGYGEIRKAKLLYFVRENASGSAIIFSDATFSDELTRNMLLTNIVGYLTAALAFLVLSYFLSGWALRPVKIAWKQQSEFIANASHELKTPLTVILADINILLQHEAKPVVTQKKWIESIRSEAMEMKKLVEEMLYLAKSDTHAHSYKMESVDFSDIVTDQILEFESIAYEKNILMNDAIELGLKVNGDRNALRQLVGILLDNACKYCTTGENGTAEVIVQLTGERSKTASKGSPQKVFLEISNTANEVSEKELHRLFDRFYRTDRSRNREGGSYGLGLSIAKDIVDAHAGEITASYCDGRFCIKVAMRDMSI